YHYIASQERRPAALRVLILGGETFTNDLRQRALASVDAQCRIFNLYGPTETAISVTIHEVQRKGNKTRQLSSVPIGRVVANAGVLVLDNHLNLCPFNAMGELYILGDGVSRGYLNKPELTSEKFVKAGRQGKDSGQYAVGSRQKEKEQKINKKKRKANEPVKGQQSPLSKSFAELFQKRPPGGPPEATLYKTGDLVRWYADGAIEFLGRVDHQVKVRGYRIELGEIENRLTRLEQVKEAVAVVWNNSDGEPYICAYVVEERQTGAAAIDAATLRALLGRSLPDYMIPSQFVTLERMPLTLNGKIDRKALPEPELETGTHYTAPRMEIEKKLVTIWEKLLLGKNTAEVSIGIDDNFFHLGGHSLKAVLLTATIHKELAVEVPVPRVFNTPTIRGMARYIQQAVGERYAAIEPAAPKQYYPLSSAQKRLYFLQQMDLASTAYNISAVLDLGKNHHIDKLETILKKLISRHESLRTSFERVNGEPKQKIHHHLEFEIEILKPGDEQAFIRPFDLSVAPLMRSGFIEHPDGKLTWIVDIHHIISDGSSHAILAEDFHTLNRGEELPRLRLQYKDYSEWQNCPIEKEKTKEQETYWLELFREEPPVLDLPLDYKRPPVFTYEGANYRFVIDREDTAAIESLASACGGTLYMSILAMLNTLFFKYTGQTDIVIGSGIAGRPHADLQRIMGMFVNTLAMRNKPREDKTYKNFFKEVIQHSVAAFENQELQFEELVDKLELQRDASRNPLFDILMVVQNFRRTAVGNQVTGYKPTTAKFDMTFFIEEADGLSVNLEYYTPIFKKETIPRIAAHLKQLIREVTRNPACTLKEIQLMTTEEKEKVLFHFNDTATHYPREKTLAELFEQQVEKYPDHIAVAGELFENTQFDPHLPAVNKGAVTYRKLNAKANRLANYLLHEKNTRNSDTQGSYPRNSHARNSHSRFDRFDRHDWVDGVGLVALLMARSVDMIISIIGVLKAGGAYVPISHSFPEERVKTMINDTGARLLIGQKRYIKALNRLQWECPPLETILCIDSENSYEEEEREESGLMDRKLWEYVGETSTDDVSGGGWNSSYTGEPIPLKEMNEYGDNIFKKLEPLLHDKMRVLEIGTASGITMYRIAPKVALYHGTDLSHVIIEKNKERVKKEGHKNIKLSCLAAHEIPVDTQPATQAERENRAAEEVDLIIINSVIQCFNGHNYLRRVLRNAARLLAPGGTIFIGDIMDQDKKRELIEDMAKFKHENHDQNYKTKTDWSEELFISKAFLDDIVIDFPELKSVRFSDKIYTIENELTKFRYDALITRHGENDLNATSCQTINDSTNNAPAHEKRAAQPFLKHKNQHDLRDLRKYGTEKVETVAHGEPAYIIYTSGSTGKPKGTLTTHYNVSRVVKDTNYIEFLRGDRVLQLSNYTFDGSVFDIYGALLNGSTLVMVSREELLDTSVLSALIEREMVTVFFLTTSLFNTLVEMGMEAFSGIRKVISGGERVSVDHMEKALGYLGRDRIIHAYGPTETTVFATCCLVNKISPNQVSIPIGAPISNTTAYILDQDLRPVPMGVNGEIYIGGPGVSKGYLNNPELTAQSFLNKSFAELFQKRPPGGSVPPHVAPPEAPVTDGIYYKTGDLGRWLEDGTIEYNGRIDQQVKVRGYRIELGEIEHCILQSDTVKECVVTANEDEMGSRFLSAYVVPDEEMETVALKEYLAHELPPFMIPTYIVSIEKLPLKSTGKIDTAKLPDPRLMLNSELSAPRDDLDAGLIRLWATVLGIAEESIGIDSNFFTLGGHSLKATVLTAKIHKEFKIKIPLAELFKHQTIRKLAGVIKNARKETFYAVEKAEKREYYPLSPAQQRLYIIQTMTPENTAYNMPTQIALPPGKEKKDLEAVFKNLIRRHESFRTTFHIFNERPVQVIADEVEFEIETLDRDASGFSRPFDLTRAPLLRVGINKQEEGEKVLLVEMHHIISDGTSMMLLGKELSGICAGKQLPPLKLQYKDYSHWLNSKEQQGIRKKQERYWRETLAGKLPVLNLPADYPRPGKDMGEGRVFSFPLDNQTTEKLFRLCKETETTLYMLLLSACNILLAKLDGGTDILVGTPVEGRRHDDLRHIIGMFVNTLVMRNYPEGNKTFLRFLKEVKQHTLDAFENQEYQFDDLVNILHVNRETGRNPIFDIMFNFLSQLESGQTGCGIGTLTNRDISENSESKSNFDMTFQAYDISGTVYFTLHYNTGLYKKETVVRLINYLKKILRELEINTLISEIQLLPDEEKAQLLWEFNDTAHDKITGQTLQGLFRAQVERTPDYPAITGRGKMPAAPADKDQLRQLTYKELDNKSDFLAGILLEKGGGPGTITGIIGEPSLETSMGILAILKTGGTYMPIDPAYPQERIDYMIKDSNAALLLGEAGQIKTSYEVIEISPIIWPPAPTAPNIRHPASSIQYPVTNIRHPAYIIYTSGTTGRPKGVVVGHDGIVNTIAYRKEEYDMNTESVSMHLISFCFDVYVTGFFTPLVSGSQLILTTGEEIGDLAKIRDLLVTYNVTHLICGPAIYRALIEAVEPAEVASLKRVTLGGEAVDLKTLEHTRQKNSNLEIVIEYGITEASVVSTLYRHQERDTKIKIGKPIWNTRVYILDKNHNPQPTGVTGELYISGTGVAEGYLNKPELTAERFLKDSRQLAVGSRQKEKEINNNTPNIDNTELKKQSPLSKSFAELFQKRPPGGPPEALYKTGDLARWHADGTIEFLGRKDGQVKIRGYRIELGEVENSLLRHPDIKEAVVVLVAPGYLCAYTVDTGSAKHSSTDLKHYLSQHLPVYMIPTYFVTMEKFPLTPNGKIDRNALPQLEKNAGRDSARTAPRDETERKLAAIWQDIFYTPGSETVEIHGIDENFFESGGHSLNATIMAAKIHKELNVKVPLGEVFKRPTIRGLADYIKNRGECADHETIEKAPEQKQYALSSVQRRMYLLQAANPDSKSYNMPVAAELEGEMNREQMEEILRQLIARHESMRTSFEMKGELPVQIIHKKINFKIQYYELTGPEPKQEIKQIVDEFIKPFDLSKPQLIRVGLIKRAETKHILMMDVHHIVSDGMSMNVFLQEFSALYEGKSLPPLRLQYKDFVHWQNSEKRQLAIKLQGVYWQEQFRETPPLLALPLDFTRPERKSFRGKHHFFEIDSRQTADLIKLAQQEDATLFMVLLATYNIMLAKLGSQEDIVVGTSIAGRRHCALYPIVGMFVNALALRNYPKPEKTAKTFLQELKNNTMEAYENQEYPFEELVAKVSGPGDRARNPLFDAMLVLNNEEELDEFRVPGLTIKPYKDIRLTSAQMDLKLRIRETGDYMTLSFEYSTDLFKEETVKMFETNFIEVVTALSADINTQLKDIKMSHGLLSTKKEVVDMDFAF
ncbi:MAG: amino acid adenylation domain-containing protein, partial [bacterium]|nr:amino acid adenylation domain-containing protein [bacterium]